jgi:DNA-binding MarR family transcriptional regulator
MSEPKPSEQYHINTDEVKDALEMLGAGYDHPSLEIHHSETVIRRRGKKLVEEIIPAFVKISTNFKSELHDIDSNALKVWLYIALSINRNTEQAHPGIRTLADACNLDKDTVSRAIKRLEALELLRVDRDTKKYNIYEIPEYVSANTKEKTVPMEGTVKESVPTETKSVPIESESVPTSWGLNQSNQSNQKKQEENNSLSEKGNPKSKRPPEGFPEPTGDTLGDWMEMGRRNDEKVKPYVAVAETLAGEFHYNFPKYGENRLFDRVLRLIAQDGRSVKEFVAWAKSQKRDPHWYHVKPDSLWGDWPQAFDNESPKIIKADSGGGFYGG